MAAEALVATGQDLHAKIRGLDDEIDNKRDLLGDLVKRHDGGAAELAGADANLASAGDRIVGLPPGPKHAVLHLVAVHT